MLFTLWSAVVLLASGLFVVLSGKNLVPLLGAPRTTPLFLFRLNSQGINRKASGHAFGWGAFRSAYPVYLSYMAPIWKYPPISGPILARCKIVQPVFY
ncbi:MAG: hypothetical protein CM1200mP41_31120 [Gammaproteobacteria bacterium]|nr:MAG: hypothetical protein CM1200mP41_31120 [Gammaproteobacteria bacterium]